MSKITTHILDTSLGKPAAGVRVALYTDANGEWIEMAAGVTNADGRIGDWGVLPDQGIFKMRFETGRYFSARGGVSFYPFVEVHFAVSGDVHYHIPLLLSPFGYSTYRGS